MTIERHQWEQAGYTVAEHTNSPPVDPADIFRVILHYPGTSSVWSYDAIDYTRSLQRAYADQRGYSLGYSWLYMPDGTEVEVRGWRYRNAANAVNGDNGDTNRTTLSLLIVQPIGQPATGAQIVAVRERRRKIDTVCNRRVPAEPHGNLEPTACPGREIRSQWAAGMFDYSPTAPPEPDPEVPDMIVCKLKGQSGAFVVSNVKTWLNTPEARDDAIRRLGPIVELDRDEFVALGPVVGEVPAGYDAFGVKT